MSVFYNNALIGASGAAAAGTYKIERSLRFNAIDGSRLNRTFAASGNRKTFTFACWVKRGAIQVQANEDMFFAATNGTIRNECFFDSDERMQFRAYNGSTFTTSLVTDARFRDSAAWQHITVAVNTTEATAANRVKIYVNGVQQSVTGTYPALNADFIYNHSVDHRISGIAAGSDYDLEGYLADFHFIDGQALTPSSFGELNTNNIWQPKAYGSTYGTNGFKLDFADNSAATATTLGKDTSGNGNNFTPTNLSVTAGTGNDSFVDTPTNYGTDTGVGGEVRGNYCTLNPLQNNSTNTLSAGNLCITGTVAAYGSALGTIGVSSGKWYWEQTLTAFTTADIQLGIGNKDTDINSYPGATSRSYGFSANNLKWNNAASAAYTTSWVAGNIIGLAFDADAGTLTLYKNGVSLGAAFTGIPADTYFPVAGARNTTSTSYLNFGQRPFAYTAPSGYKALCTTNLPTPTITKPSTVMGVLTYTGNGASQVITGLGFSPDLVWIKQRSSTQSHCINDAVRGAGSYLSSDTTNAENSTPNVLTGFVPGGYTLGSEAIVNANTATYVAWCWDESASAGFDIVTYTGNGANRTIAHSLGVAPAFMVFKQRTAASATSWAVWHSSLANTDYLLLNSTAATATAAAYWNNTSPTSSVFSLGAAAAVNANSGTYVGYLWAPVAGYSAMGSYTGNGSTDGTFVYTNMRPRFIMLKRTDTTSNWTILDTSRAGYNVDNNPLNPDLSGNEGTLDILDIVSNGFKLRTADISVNANAGTYLYVAFAEAPFSLARAR